MGRKIFSMVAGVVFSLVTLLHILRLALRWQVTVDDAVIPMWVSWVATPLAAFLAYQSFKFGRNTK